MSAAVKFTSQKSLAGDYGVSTGTMKSLVKRILGRRKRGLLSPGEVRKLVEYFERLPPSSKHSTL